MNDTDEVGIFPQGYPKARVRVWHPLTAARSTRCGLWPDTFAKYKAVKPVEHAMGGGWCARVACRCNNGIPMCGNCARRHTA